MANTIGPKIAVVDSIPDGATYGDDGRAMLRMLQTLVMPNVINMTTSAAPGSPTNGDTYVVASAGSGAWVGKTNYVAYWSTDNPSAPSGEWEFYQPKQGWIVANQADNTQYIYNGSTWSAISGGGGASLSVTTTTLTAAQVKDLANTPALILAAPGANKVLVPVSIFFQVKQGATPFNSSTAQYYLQYGNATDNSAPAFTLLGGGDVNDPTGQIVINGTYQFIGYGIPAQFVDVALYLWNFLGHTFDPTLGDGTFIFTITYYTQTIS